MAEGVVFDLGYRPHEGPRLGRWGAARALFRDGLRRVFGLRRKARRKILPALLVAIAVLPALFFVAAGVMLGEMGTETFFSHADYFNLAGNVSLVFCALAASELLIPDRVSGTLAVYASRPLTARDYLGGRAASMAAVVFGFVWLPHVLLLIGRAWTSSDGFASYLTGHIDDVWQTAASVVVYIIAFGSLAFLVAIFSTRPALAVFAFLVTVFAWNGTTQALVNADYDAAGVLALIDHPNYVKDWIMGADTGRWIPEQAGLEPIVSLAVIVAFLAVTVYAGLRRYRGLL